VRPMAIFLRHTLPIRGQQTPLFLTHVALNSSSWCPKFLTTILFYCMYIRLRPQYAMQKPILLLRSPVVLVVAGFLALVLLLAFRGSTVAHPSATFEWRKAAPTGGTNYRSASWSRRPSDTTSELGRASNATLGVSAFL
jgi:hypothetical protein